MGATRPVDVDVGIVAAAQTDLQQLVAAGRFREDLLARLGGMVVALPRLAERKEDLGLLISVLLRRVAGASAESLKLSAAAACALFAYGWPLNVRELERALESAALLAGGWTIEPEHLPEAVRRARAVPRPAPAMAGPAIRERLVDLLQSSGGNVSAVARALGKTRAGASVDQTVRLGRARLPPLRKRLPRQWRRFDRGRRRIRRNAGRDVKIG